MGVSTTAAGALASIACMMFCASAAHAEGASPPVDASLVVSAMSAAPAAVARGAAVVAMDPEGNMRTIRPGSNGFTCMPDDPATPGPDPRCMDPGAMEWLMARAERRTPPKKTGFIYMLAGGVDASNSDPHARKPAPGRDWIRTGPHVMIVGNAEMLVHYPDRAEPDTTQPYVMWSDTPYAHLVIPVR